jgi:hypothetical protein
MTSTALGWGIELVLVLGSAFLAYKLYRTGLYRRYPVFFAYFVFRVLNSVSPVLLDTSSAEYQKIWICVEPIVIGFYILLVRELYRLVLEKYKGLYTLGRWAMYLSMTVAVLISGLSLIPKITPNMPQRSKIMFYLFATERGVDTALVIFIVLLLLFLSRYPVRLSRNVRIYAILYSVFFLSNTLSLLMRSLFGLQMAGAFNVLHLAVSAACVVAWLILLSPQGAEAAIAPAVFGPQYENRLLTQLDSMNAALLNVGHRRVPQANFPRS